MAKKSKYGGNRKCDDCLSRKAKVKVEGQEGTFHLCGRCAHKKDVSFASLHHHNNALSKYW
jgi:protein-arginine kinase activator protein McsA